LTFKVRPITAGIAGGIDGPAFPTADLCECCSASTVGMDMFQTYLRYFVLETFSKLPPQTCGAGAESMCLALIIKSSRHSQTRPKLAADRISDPRADHRLCTMMMALQFWLTPEGFKNALRCEQIYSECFSSIPAAHCALHVKRAA
jgi:hypothetical protein